jgi:hypothetical protein
MLIAIGLDRLRSTGTAQSTVRHYVVTGLQFTGAIGKSLIVLIASARAVREITPLLC